MNEIHFLIGVIGIVISAYVTVRCLSFMTRQGERKEHWTVVTCSVLTLLISSLALIMILHN